MGKRSASVPVIVVLSAAVAFGSAPCAYANPQRTSATRDAAASAEAERMQWYRDLLQRHGEGDLLALRVRVDAARKRLWVLTLEHVYVYDTRSRELIRRIDLPKWSVATDFVCPPDIAIDRRGSAFVSNNLQPRLLQIDAREFRTKEHRLRLVASKQWDIGFGALAFRADGTLLALSAVGGAMFTIDLARGTATQIAQAKRNTRAVACAPE